MSRLCPSPCSFSNAKATTPNYTLSLHDALPIFPFVAEIHLQAALAHVEQLGANPRGFAPSCSTCARDRKSTRLNSSHGYISYAVFCLKKKNKIIRSLYYFARTTLISTCTVS